MIKDYYWYKSKKRKKIKTNSWFNTNTIINENFRNFDNLEKPINKFLCCKEVEIYHNLEQRELLLKWMNQFIDMYNHTNYFLNNNIYDYENKKLKKIVKKY